MADHRCQGRVMAPYMGEEIVKGPDGNYVVENGHYKTARVKKEKLRLCAKTATTFVKAEYSDLFTQRESKFDDVFPFCGACWDRVRKMGLAAFNRQKWGDDGRIVNMVRGTVKSFDLTDSPDGIMDAKARRLLGLKADLKRIMCQKNSGGLTLDDWRKVFQDAMDEFVVEETLRS